MSSGAGGRPEVKGMIAHPPAVCSRVWPRRYVLPGVCLSVCLSVCLLSVSNFT